MGLLERSDPRRRRLPRGPVPRLAARGRPHSRPRGQRPRHGHSPLGRRPRPSRRERRVHHVLGVRVAERDQLDPRASPRRLASRLRRELPCRRRPRTRSVVASGGFVLEFDCFGVGCWVGVGIVFDLLVFVYE